ncbi:hypothetical protein BU23DRAFT_260711 [Bimuria novae-zelandiae CBS 107.79]|uniref:Uncharacterized protein n=1 Tax=Bimuria novae-zelandiae CBS 107.79 TaxID=1447943 RepID=A0A6A5UTZ8_9PLEO|nr:hypothetical protein BU23DRAFT_260711 [Bimuria novae-zelandiae CBS 107.79]
MTLQTSYRSTTRNPLVLLHLFLLQIIRTHPLPRVLFPPRVFSSVPLRSLANTAKTTTVRTRVGPMGTGNGISSSFFFGGAEQ